MARGLLAALALVALATGAAAQRGQPLPVEKTATLREDDAVWYIDGRQRIPRTATLTSLRRGRIVGRGEGAVLEVEGGLDLRAVTGGEVVIQDVWVEPLAGCKGLTLLNCRFEGKGGLRTSSLGPAKAKLILNKSRFVGSAELDLELTAGQVALMGFGSEAPVRIACAVEEGERPGKLELTAVGCQGKQAGFDGGLRVEGVREVLVRHCDLAGELSVFADCPKLTFDGNHARSARIEVRHSEPRSFSRTEISNTDFRCKELILFQPAKSTPQKVQLVRCYFDGLLDEDRIRAELVEDCGRDTHSGVLADFAKIQEDPLGFGGRP